MRPWKRLRCQSLSIQVLLRSSTWRWNRYSHVSLTAWKYTGMPSTFPSLQLLTDSLSRNLLLPTRSRIAWVWTPKNWPGGVPSMPLWQTPWWRRWLRSFLLGTNNPSCYARSWLQEAQVAAVSASFAAASNLQLLRWDALLKNFGFQPQVLSNVRTVPFEGSHILGLEPKVLQQRVQTIRQADRMAGSSVTFVQKPKESNQTSTKKTSSTKKSQQCLSAWVRLLLRPCRGPYLKISRFVLVLAEEPVTDPSQDNVGRLGQLLQLPPPASFDRVQVGARLADFSPQWRSLLGSCRATITVEDGVGIVFLQQPQLTHQCISFRTRNCCQDLQQAVDALLAKGAIERVNDETSLGFYSRLFLVPKKTGDLRPIIDLSTLHVCVQLGLGGQLGSHSTQGLWLASQRSWHINVLEMQAVINAMRAFLPHLKSRLVRLMCDNAVTVACLHQERGGTSYTLMQLMLRLLKWCDRKVITLVPLHLPGVHNVQAT